METRIIESYVVGKRNEAECEDAIVVTEDFIAVIDGSTSKTPLHLSPTMKNGRYATLLTTAFIQEELKADATVTGFCQGITSYIYKVYEQAGVTERMQANPVERLAASAVVYSRSRQEVWMVGDCQTLVDGVLYENPKPYEERIANRRAELIRHGMPPVEARKAIEPLLIEAITEGQNRQYAVIDGFPIYPNGVKVIPCAPSQAPDGASPVETVLASDGYPTLLPTLAASEEALASQLADDPQNIRSFIATKGLVEGNRSFDDRAYIRFAVSR